MPQQAALQGVVTNVCPESLAIGLISCDQRLQGLQHLHAQLCARFCREVQVEEVDDLDEALRVPAQNRRPVGDPPRHWLWYFTAATQGCKPLAQALYEYQRATAGPVAEPSDRLQQASQPALLQKAGRTRGLNSRRHRPLPSSKSFLIGK